MKDTGDWKSAHASAYEDFYAATPHHPAMITCESKKYEPAKALAVCHYLQQTLVTGGKLISPNIATIHQAIKDGTHDLDCPYDWANKYAPRPTRPLARACHMLHGRLRRAAGPGTRGTPTPPTCPSTSRPRSTPRRPTSASRSAARSSRVAATAAPAAKHAPPGGGDQALTRPAASLPVPDTARATGQCGECAWKICDVTVYRSSCA